ncbi:MAG: FKBP-type peptidyl-prolyl cis-trans isomerase [Parabacteroides sp.]
MKKFGFIAWICLCAFWAVSCGDDDTLSYAELLEQYADWKAENEQAIQKIATDPNYTALKSQGNDGSIYIKVLKEGNGTTQIYYTDSVTVYYTGKTIDDVEFDTCEPPYQEPRVFAVSGVVSGWATALQYMHIGDRWEAWIPQELGYSYSGSSSILPFSALHFEMEVVNIIRNGETIIY